MAIQFSIVILGAPVAKSEDGLTDVIKAVSWSRVAQQEVEINGEAKLFSTGYPGVTQLGAPSPAAFTPYNEVTEAQMIQWVNDAVGDWTQIDTGLVNSLQSQINPPVVNLPLPWQQ
jgi:hypothetical protein